MNHSIDATMWHTVRYAIVGWPQTVRLIIIVLVIAICYIAVVTLI